MPQLGQQSLEPLCVTGRLDPHTNRLRQPFVKLSRLAVGVFQSLLDQLSGFRIQHRDVLLARVKITAYNHHRSAPSFRALVVLQRQVYSLEGADAFIQSRP
jgi:hypothetical protein